MPEHGAAGARSHERCVAAAGVPGPLRTAQGRVRSPGPDRRLSPAAASAPAHPPTRQTARPRRCRPGSRCGRRPAAARASGRASRGRGRTRCRPAASSRPRCAERAVRGGVSGGANLVRRREPFTLWAPGASRAMAERQAPCKHPGVRAAPRRERGVQLRSWMKPTMSFETVIALDVCPAGERVVGSHSQPDVSSS